MRRIRQSRAVIHSRPRAAMTMIVCWMMVLVLLLSSMSTCTAQRFMRQGFSNNEDFGSEMALEDKEGAVDMTREMFIMKDMEWNLQPIDDLDIKDKAVKKHIQKYLSRPVELKLFKKRGKYGLRAVGRTESGQKLRAFWRQANLGDSNGNSSRLLKASDFLTASYDEAVRARLFTVEFELQLPPVKKSSKALPSVVYQFSVEPGSMNPKALVPRGAGRVSVFPAGRAGSEKETDAGKAMVGAVRMKAGLIDPGWAKGRPIFRRGRKSGLM